MGICSSGGNTDQFDLNLLNYVEEARCFYVITVVFNPARSRTRIKLYSNFKKQMEKFGARLITVECVYENSPFTLTQPNYEPYNIQVKTNSAFFQKENLINLAVSKLPHDAKYIAWIDYEVEFTNHNWLNDSIKALNMFKIAQLFDEISLFNVNGEEIGREKGFASLLGNKKNLDKKVFEATTITAGYGWAIRKEAFKELGGLIDYTLINTGEKTIAYCLAGKIDEYVPDVFCNHFKDSLKSWQKKSEQIFPQGIGFIPGMIRVVSNTFRRDKKYLDRWDILANNNFDQKIDLVKDNNGLYVLVESKQKLIEELKNLFDGINAETMEI